LRTEDVEAVADALLVASRALIGVAARSISAAGDVTVPQFRALVVLSGAGTMSVTELADVLDVHQSSATRLCDRLVRKELIRRLPSRGDRRESELSLAPAGRRLVGGVTSRRRRELASIAAGMTADERRRALEGLRAFAAAAGEAGVPPADLGWL
jgi:DNA-binding MarR family transcriptional regulator